MANGQDETEMPPPNGTNNTDNDEIEELPSKERLERLKLQAEIKEIEKPFYFKKSFIATISSLVVSLGVAGYFSGWFDVKQEKLENQSILLEANTVTLKREKDILVNRKKELELNTEKLEAEKTLLEEEYKTKNSELVKMFEDKKVNLDEEYKEKSQELKEEHDKEILTLKEEHTKLKEEVKSMSSFTNWYDKAVGEYVHKRYEEAISSFTSALSKKSDDGSRAFALNYRGGIYLKIDKDKEALADFDESVRLKPDNPRPYHNRTLIYFNRQDYKRAYEEYKEAIRLYNIDGEDITAFTFSAEMNDLFKQVEGEEEIKASIKKNGNELGQHLMKQGKLKEIKE